MYPERPTLEAIAALRAALDRFDVVGRLQHIRNFVWRGGELQFSADPRHGGHYVLVAEWPAAVLEPAATVAPGTIVALAQPLLDGRWVRGTKTYSLRVGIELAVPSAICVRADAWLSHVPLVGRIQDDVEHGLQVELAAYVQRFLSASRPVPEAAAADLERLRRLGLD